MFEALARGYLIYTLPIGSVYTALASICFTRTFLFFFWITRSLYFNWNFSKQGFCM